MSARARAGIALVLVAGSAYLLADPQANLHQLLVLAHKWPIFAIALAGLLLLQAVPTIVGRVLIVALSTIGALGVIGSAALPSLETTAQLCLSALIAGGVIFLLRKERIPRIAHRSLLWSRHITVPRGELPTTSRLVSLCGALHWDARSSSLPEPANLDIHIIMGEVEIQIPATWHCHVDSAETSMIVFRDRGEICDSGPKLDLHITGRLGRLTVTRL